MTTPPLELSLPDDSPGSLRRFLHGLPGVDEVGANARVASLGTRSIKNDAKAWAMTQGKFNASQHMEHAYAKIKEDCKPANAREMWQCWYLYVTEHAPAKAQAADAQPDADQDGWQEIDANGVTDAARF